MKADQNDVIYSYYTRNGESAFYYKGAVIFISWQFLLYSIIS